MQVDGVSFSDFISMASYRVTGSAVAMGEAVGRAAARAAAVVL